MFAPTVMIHADSHSFQCPVVVRNMQNNHGPLKQEPHRLRRRVCPHHTVRALPPPGALPKKKPNNNNKKTPEICPIGVKLAVLIVIFLLGACIKSRPGFSQALRQARHSSTFSISWPIALSSRKSHRLLPEGSCSPPKKAPAVG